MDREQKIRFLKEVVFTAKEIKEEDNPELHKLYTSFQKGMFAKMNLGGLSSNFSEEDFDQVVKESPWVVDAVFQMVEMFNSTEEVDFGQEEHFKMNDLYRGVQDLMQKYQDYEREQKEF